MISKKTNDKSFQKIPKKTYFGAILGPFLPKFTYKKGLSVFKYSNYLPSRSKSEKTKDPLLRKMPNWRTERWTDGRTDGRTDRQTENGDFFRTLCNGGPMRIS